ncbi:TPR repeat region-containing protein [Rhodococcus zopfii]|uniref:TPR repeat region-containing protein n=1 Tax=Rhodococcus zopfii TaxID=43772 RepID=UPI003B8A630E
MTCAGSAHCRTARRVAGHARLCPGAVRHARGRRVRDTFREAGFGRCCRRAAAPCERFGAHRRIRSGHRRYVGRGGGVLRQAGHHRRRGGQSPGFLTAVPDAGLLDRFTQSYGAGDAALQQGNPISRALLERAGELAALDPGPRSAVELRDAGSTTFDGLLGHLVTAGGRDQESVHGMMVDPDSREDRILPLLQHDWSNSGEPAVSRMFEWIAADATATGDDPGAIERATRAGETAFGLS